jgi:hypothetical protein
MHMRSLRSLAIAAFAAGGIASAAALTIDPAQHAIDGVRNARYCEMRSGFHLLATVYNTLGVNDCPAAVWYVFEAGKPVFLLVAPDGARYAMQAYAQMIDKSLSYDDLPGLDVRLKLPKGWRYESMVPASDLVLGAHGEAIIVQDDLDDTYQKLD